MKEVVILIVYDQHNESPLYHIYQNIKIKLKSTFDNQIKTYSSHNWNIVSKWHWNFECKIQIEDPLNNKRFDFCGRIKFCWKEKKSFWNCGHQISALECYWLLYINVRVYTKISDKRKMTLFLLLVNNNNNIHWQSNCIIANLLLLIRLLSFPMMLFQRQIQNAHSAKCEDM